MEYKINPGEMLREIKFHMSSTGDAVILTYYNAIAGKSAKLFIEVNQIDEVIDILNRFKK